MSYRGQDDLELQCMDCGDAFVFTASEQQFYQQKQFTQPKRCAKCRRAKKEQRRYE